MNEKKNVRIKHTFIVIYNKSKIADLELQRIKESHINVLISQLKSKLVLAKNLRLFKFLIPKNVLMFIIELDPSFIYLTH